MHLMSHAAIRLILLFFASGAYSQTTSTNQTISTETHVTPNQTSTVPLSLMYAGMIVFFLTGVTYNPSYSPVPSTREWFRRTFTAVSLKVFGTQYRALNSMGLTGT